jgi:hypothetical protein
LTAPFNQNLHYLVAEMSIARRSVTYANSPGRGPRHSHCELSQVTERKERW